MLGRLLGFGEESRAISYQSLFASGADISFRTPSGVPMDQDKALKVSAVYAAVRLLSDTISTLPVDTFIRRDGQRVPYRPRPEWVYNPDIGTSKDEFIQQIMISLLLDGNAFVRVFRATSGPNAGLPTALVVLDPTKVEVRRNAVGEIEYLHNYRTVIARQDMLHMTELKRPGSLRGVSRIDELKDTLGMAQALTDFASRFFGQGSVTSGIIETPAMITKEQALDLKTTFEASHRGVDRSHRVGVLGGGSKFVKTGVDPDEAQMLESRILATEEICRIFRIPPHMLQMNTPGAMSYASVEQNAIQFSQYTLRPYISKIETALTTLLPGDAFYRINLDGLLRGDFQTRMAGYSTAIQMGAFSINDVRRLEDLSPVDGGDEHRVPLANVNVNAANLTEQEKRVNMLTRLVQLGFDPAESLSSVGLAPIEHTGLPTVQLQPPASLDPLDPEAAYPVRDLDPAEFAEAIGAQIRGLPQPIINVQVPEPPARSKRVERDAHGNITGIVEE
jgi:HK97 family phage portal protein